MSIYAEQFSIPIFKPIYFDHLINSIKDTRKWSTEVRKIASNNCNQYVFVDNTPVIITFVKDDDKCQVSLICCGDTVVVSPVNIENRMIKWYKKEIISRITKLSNQSLKGRM